LSSAQATQTPLKVANANRQRARPVEDHTSHQTVCFLITGDTYYGAEYFRR